MMMIHDGDDDDDSDDVEVHSKGDNVDGVKNQINRGLTVGQLATLCILSHALHCLNTQQLRHFRIWQNSTSLKLRFLLEC